MARLALFFNVLEAAHRMDIQKRRNIQRMRRYNSRALAMDAEEFQRNYRLSKELFDLLVDDLSPLMKRPTRRSDISIKCKVSSHIVYWWNYNNISDYILTMNQCTITLRIYVFQILIALSFFASGSYQRIVGRACGTTMSQQSVSRCIRDVVNALNHNSILAKYIRFPQSLEERNIIKRKKVLLKCIIFYSHLS